jgi:hypothetical protein
VPTSTSGAASAVRAPGEAGLRTRQGRSAGVHHGTGSHWVRFRNPRVVAILELAGIVALLTSSFSAFPAPMLGPPPGPQLAVRAESPGFPTPIHHVIVLFMEDQNYTDVIANGSFERYLASHYAAAGDYYGLTSDSAVNYRYVTSGADSTHPAATIPSLVDAAGETWGAYMESMPTPCDPYSTVANTTLPSSVVGNTTNHTVYDVNHDPFVSYQSIVGNASYCDAHVVNLDAWTTVLENGSLPNYAFVAPNDTDNDHHCPPVNLTVHKEFIPRCPGAIPHGDAWLQSFISPFVNSSVFRDSVLFLAYDYGFEEAQPAGTLAHVYCVAVSPYSRTGYSSPDNYSHFDLLTSTEYLLGLGHTGSHDNWTAYPPMVDLFNFSKRFPATFTESGLPTGTGWSVTLNGTERTSTGTTIDFDEPTGSYAYSLGTVSGYHSNRTAGVLNVAGGAAGEQVEWTPNATYEVTFSEQGLPTGTNWSVEIDGAVHDSISAVISVALANSSYPYSVGAVPGYVASPRTGSVIVAGLPQNVVISWSSQLYNVSFEESGLPTGARWSVLVGTLRQNSTTDSIVFAEPNATYSYTVEGIPGYQPTPPSGEVVVNGSSLAVPVTWSRNATFSLEFIESGLSTGTNWSVDVAGTRYASTSSTIQTSEMNGSYPFSVGPVAGYTVNRTSGTVVIAGEAETVWLSWTPTEFEVEINESGLPPGTNWSVTFSGVEKSSSTNTIVFWAPNGSYSLSVATLPGYHLAAYSRLVPVAGGPVRIDLNWTLTTFSVTFLETGLPGGTNWSITLNATTLSSTAATIVFWVPNGSFAFEVVSVSGFSASPDGDTVVVAGHSNVTKVLFTSTNPGSAGGSAGRPNAWPPAVWVAVAVAIVASAGAAGAWVAARRRRHPPPPARSP